MKRRALGLGGGLAGTAALICVLLLVARKGPMSALWIVLIVSILIGVLSVGTALLAKKKDGR